MILKKISRGSANHFALREEPLDHVTAGVSFFAALQSNPDKSMIGNDRSAAQLNNSNVTPKAVVGELQLTAARFVLQPQDRERFFFERFPELRFSREVCLDHGRLYAV